MVGTGRFMVMGDDPDDSSEGVEIDSDVLVTEQRLIDLGLPVEEAKRLAPQLVDAALNAPCTCCESDGRHSESSK